MGSVRWGLVRFLPLLLLVSCVTVEAGRRVSGQRFVGTACAPGQPIVSVDTTRRNQVRLVFNRLDPCVDTYEVTTTVETGRQLVKPARIAIAIIAAVAVAVPLLILMSAIAPKGAAYEGTTAYSVNQALSAALMIPVVAAGSAVYGATDGPLPLPPFEVTQQVERDARAATADVAVTAGVVSAPGLGARPLVNGSLDLTLAEGVALDPKKLTLDGVPVSLPWDAEERLSYLALCKAALEAPTVALAEVCARHGWGFADALLPPR